ncbi:hypothetical protein JTB14_037026 [Gonioctena quinquepunctata]|nr:hypothetical protein JTB14_037026 [Gonioctena quinquepunctata]
MVSFTQVSGAAIDSSTPSSEGSAETGTVVYETGLVDSLLKTIIEPLRQAVGPALDIIEEFLNKVVPIGGLLDIVQQLYTVITVTIGTYVKTITGVN